MLETKPLEVTMRGMGNEKYIRSGCPCCGENKKIICNWCNFKPKYPLNHKHKFFYSKTIIQKRLFGLIKKRIRVSTCPCGEVIYEYEN